jgi:hypothetical protein
MKSKFRILSAFILTSGLQILWHWLITLKTDLANKLLRFYLSFDPKVHKGVAGWFDLVLPCVLLGIFTGLSTWRWPLQKVVYCVAIVAAGLVALLPVYVWILRKEFVWWWPHDVAELIIYVIERAIEAIALLSVFIYAVRLIGHRQLELTRQP